MSKSYRDISHLKLSQNNLSPITEEVINIVNSIRAEITRILKEEDRPEEYIESFMDKLDCLEYPWFRELIKG